MSGLGQENSGIYAERRRMLAERLGDGVIAIPGYTESEGQSGFTGFRQESNFYYLTGHSEPGAALLIAPSKGRVSYCEALFLPQQGSLPESWTVPRTSPEEAGRLGFQEVLATGNWPQELQSLIKDRKLVYSLHPLPGSGAESVRDKHLFARLENDAGTTNIRDVRRHLSEMRSIKSSGEILMLQKAVDATVSAHREAWKIVKAGVSEHQVMARFIGAAYESGCARMAYPPIVGAGKNASILHYHRNDSTLENEQLLLMDMGGEHSRYAADITRTVPVSGKFSEYHRELYEVVHQAQQKVIAALRPGMVLNSLRNRSMQQIVSNYFQKHLQRFGVEGRLPHALGHHVGLDVHDPAPVRDILKPGMVVTIEPGIYLPDERLGIRIEDMVEVTKDGCRVMSSTLPSEANAIQRALNPVI